MKILDQINKKYGAASVFFLGQEAEPIPVIPTGSLRLDMALGVGGISLGRIAEIYGPEGSGKTTLCQNILANCQMMGGVGAIVDVEHSLDPNWLKLSNVNTEALIVSQPDSGEEALDIVEMLIRSKEVDVVVVDSVAALVPKAEIEGEMGDAHMALQARLMSQAMRKLSGVVKSSNVSLIFTNQLRDNIGGYGQSEVTTGGKALRYYASVRLDLRSGQADIIKEQGESIGKKVKVTVRKNKVAPPYQLAEFTIYFNSGIDQLVELIDYGVDLGLIEKSVGWYTFQGKKIQGLQNVRAELMADLQLIQSLDDKVRNYLRLPLKRIKVD